MLLPSKESVLAAQQDFEAWKKDHLGKVQRAVANREECGYEEARMTRIAMEGYSLRSEQLIEALNRIEELEARDETSPTLQTDPHGNVWHTRLVGTTPKNTTQGLHDTGPEVEEIFDETKRSGSESGT